MSTRFRQRLNALDDGFSLVEIAIVTAIIALIVATITVGANLVESSRVRKQITQLEQLESPIQNFRTKYNCYPGDCADPTVISGYTYSGNGNGFLEATWNDDENKGFWIHLVQSKMLNQTLYDHAALSGMRTPKMILNEQGLINAYGSMCFSQNVLEFATTSVAGALAMSQISYIDLKTDDGKPNSGTIRSSGYGSGSSTIYAADPTFPLSSSNKDGSDKCLSSGAYGVSAAYDRCNMIYIMEDKSGI